MFLVWGVGTVSEGAWQHARPTLCPHGGRGTRTHPYRCGNLCLSTFHASTLSTALLGAPMSALSCGKPSASRAMHSAIVRDTYSPPL